MRTFLKILAALVLIIALTIASLYRPDLSAEAANSRYQTAESRFLEVMDAHVHVRIRGTGPALMLIHGSFSSLHTWQPWEDSLSREFTTISMDLPGHGLTGPNRDGDYSQDYYTRVAFGIADQLGIDTFHVAGNSMGGNVAYRMALLQPRRIQSLVLIDAAGPPTSSTNKTRSASGSPFIFKLLSMPVLSSLMVKCTPKFLFHSTLKGVYSEPSLITTEQVDRYYDLILREGNRKATLDRIRTIRTPTPSGTVQCPTYILWGADDHWIPVSTAESFHAAIPGSVVEVMRGTGHVPMEERPVESLEGVRGFLRQQISH